MKEITDAALADLRASLSVCNPLVQSLVMRLDRVEGELEREHIRLAACGVAALCNTEDSMAQQIVGPGNQYYSASYGDVISAVNREMALRERVKRMEVALHKYGKHAATCHHVAGMLCDCGLSAALKEGE